MLKKVSDEIAGKWVRFEGWMLYDYFHENAAKSTRPDQLTCTKPKQKKCNWHAMSWEVHPVTKYTVVCAIDLFFTFLNGTQPSQPAVDS